MKLYLMAEEVFCRLQKVVQALAAEQSSMSAARVQNTAATLDWVVTSADVLDSVDVAASYSVLFEQLREMRKSPAYWKFFDGVVLQHILERPERTEDGAAN